MMAGDQRLAAMDGFTSVTHSSVPENRRPELYKLPASLTVCIIGAGKGIGEHISYAYARAHAANIVVAARSMGDLERVARSISEINSNIRVECATCDIASAESVSQLADHVKITFGRLDVLVCNAAYAGPVTLKVHQGDPAWVQRAFDVNMMGTYHAAHYFIPLLIESEGGAKIFLATGSLAAAIRRGPIANMGYCVSKMAQARLIEFVAEQYQHQGLLALSIHPGAVATDMAAGNTPEEFLPYLTDDVALCGAVCVWVVDKSAELQWLCGRFICATWDLDKLLSKKDEIIRNDSLKLTMAAA